jgi:hypothetical protein
MAADRLSREQALALLDAAATEDEWALALSKLRSYILASVPAAEDAPPADAPPPDAIVEVELGEWTQKVRDAVYFARVVARSKGYALAVHGSLARDIDLVAVPWVEEAASAAELAEAVRAAAERPPGVLTLFELVARQHGDVAHACALALVMPS